MCLSGFSAQTLREMPEQAGRDWDLPSQNGSWIDTAAILNCAASRVQERA